MNMNYEPSLKMKTLPFALLSLGVIPLPTQGRLFDVGPDYEEPSIETSGGFRDDVSGVVQPVTDWWSLFDDPVMESLIRSALEENQDLVAAAHRVDQARAMAGQVRADLFPQLAINANASRGKSLESSYQENNYASIPGLLSYEIDLWGGIRRGASAARSEAEVAQFRYDAAWISLSAEVAGTVYLLRAATVEEEIVRRSVQTREEARDVIGSRRSLGSATELDLARAETELANAEADLAAVSQRRSQLANALALLLGRQAPEFDASVVGSALPEPIRLPAGLPATVLSQRPDVAAAERALSATADRIGVAKAAFYPSISLTGSAGWESRDFDAVFSSDNRVWSIGPQVYLPLFQGKRNSSRLARSVAAFEEQEALFRQTVLVALREVQDALSNGRYLAAQDVANDRAVESARHAAELSRTRYEAGYVGYLEVVDSERVALTAERVSIQLHAQRLLTNIELIKALGAGWEHPVTVGQK
jgi:multidrug efflux system outer membrane protein